MSRSPVRSERTDSYRGRDDSRGWGGDSTTRRDNTPPLRRDSQRSCTWNSPSNRSDGGSWDGYSTPTRRTGGGQRQNAYDSPSNRSSRYGTPNSTENVWRGAPALKPKPKPASPEWKGAPAFKPKKKTEDDEHRFQYLRSDYATEETADSTEGKIFAPWQQADTIGAPVNMDMENPELDVANGVREKFVRPEDLLKGDLYKTAMKSGKYVIHSQIGDHMVVTGEQKVDQRALLLNRDGTGYTDGKDHGQIKKRYIEEWQKRLVDRDGELKVACRIQQRWDNMSQEEKDRCYAIRAESKRILDPLVRAEISYGIPEEYMGRQASVRPPRRRPIGK